MTAPTHILIGLAAASLANADYTTSAICALGALSPDLDTPHSSLGRVLFFVSHPLNQRFGHRGVIHGAILWGILLIVGIVTHSTRLQWFALGGISHILADCYNVSGVRLAAPYSDKIFVLFKRDWRIKTGSIAEIILFAIMAAILPAARYSNSIGGPRRLINLLARSPVITAEEFQRAGNLRCYAEGEWRWNDGRIERVEWLVVGTEANWLVLYDGHRLVKKKHGEFLRSTLKQTPESWSLLKVNSIVTVKTAALFFDGKLWHLAKPGEKALGIIKPLDTVLLEIEP